MGVVQMATKRAASAATKGTIQRYGTVKHLSKKYGNNKAGCAQNVCINARAVHCAAKAVTKGGRARALNAMAARAPGVVSTSVIATTEWCCPASSAHNRRLVDAKFAVLMSPSKKSIRGRMDSAAANWRKSGRMASRWWRVDVLSARVLARSNVHASSGVNF